MSDKDNSLNKIFSPLKHRYSDRITRIVDPASEFTKQLELYKLKSEIKPRKYNQMATHNAAALTENIGELEEEVKRIFFPVTRGKQ